MPLHAVLRMPSILLNIPRNGASRLLLQLAWGTVGKIDFGRSTPSRTRASAIDRAGSIHVAFPRVKKFLYIYRKIYEIARKPPE